MSIAQMLLPEFDQEATTTRKVLERCPEDKYGWKPHEKSFSMAALATHVANVSGWVPLTMSGDSFDVNPPGAAPYKEEPVASRAELLKKFDENTAAARAAIESATDEQMMQPWSLLSGGQTMFTMPRSAVLRSMIMNHAVHHRAQLTVYLRLNDVAVPSIYGPSADES